MGLGKVPFEHVGFDERVKAYPFRPRNAAENLAWIQGQSDSQIAAVRSLLLFIFF